MRRALMFQLSLRCSRAHMTVKSFSVKPSEAYCEMFMENV
jgi:hypothetical protein